MVNTAVKTAMYGLGQRRAGDGVVHGRLTKHADNELAELGFKPQEKDADGNLDEGEGGQNEERLPEDPPPEADLVRYAGDGHDNEGVPAQASVALLDE